MFDTTTQQWSTATLSVALGNTVAASTQDLVFITGNTYLSSGEQGAVEIFNCTAGAWRRHVTGTDYDGSPSIGAEGNTVIIAGALGIADIYDIVADNWTTYTLQYRDGYYPTVGAGCGKIMYVL
jgi:hypothetical protein